MRLAIRFLPLLALLTLAALARAESDAPSKNGFRLEPSSVPPEEIRRGGPERDGIPALDSPAALAASAAAWHDDEMVMGIEIGGEARAYPVAILNWHELVNDTLGERPILVTYCPLCGTGLVFDRRIAGKTRTFGVSGLLYKSDVLFFDRESESLWSQIKSAAVAGPATGARLDVIRSRMVRWGDWRERHPNTTVLSLETGHRRNYAENPYGSYATSDGVMLPGPLDGRYHPKMPTLGVRTRDGAARAYTGVELVNAGGQIEETFQGHRLRVAYDSENQVFEVEVPDELEVIEGYWFAWAAFHPETTIFVAVPEADQ
jgi:hypothetical protein